MRFCGFKKKKKKKRKEKWVLFVTVGWCLKLIVSVEMLLKFDLFLIMR